MSWLKELDRRKEDRGFLADLRCGLTPSKRARAGCALYRLGIAQDDDRRIFLAALYATHLHNEEIGNFGETCRRLDRLQKGQSRSDEEKASPLEKRFQHLLAAKSFDELSSRVLRLALYAKANDVPIDYARLETDLHFWGDKVRQYWAGAFWKIEPDANSDHLTNEGATL